MRQLLKTGCFLLAISMVTGACGSALSGEAISVGDETALSQPDQSDPVASTGGDDREYPEPPALSQDISGGSSVVCYELEAAPIDEGEIGFAATVEAFRDNIDWWVVIDGSQTRRAIGEEWGQYVVPVDPATSVESTTGYEGLATPSELRTKALMLALADAGMDNILVGANRTSTTVVMVPALEGSWQYVLPCGATLRSTLIDAGQSVGVAVNDDSFDALFLDLIGGGNVVDGSGTELGVADSSRWLDALRPAADPEIISWEATAPQVRLTDDAPDEILARLESRVVLLSIPESWLGSPDFTICSRTPIGWNSCTPLNRSEPSADSDSVQIPLVDGRIPLEILREPGADVEIILLNGFGDIGGQLRVIGQIPSVAFDTAGEIPLDITSEDGAEDIGLQADAKATVTIGELSD